MPLSFEKIWDQSKYSNFYHIKSGNADINSTNKGLAAKELKSLKSRLYNIFLSLFTSKRIVDVELVNQNGREKKCLIVDCDALIDYLNQITDRNNESGQKSESSSPISAMYKTELFAQKVFDGGKNTRVNINKGLFYDSLIIELQPKKPIYQSPIPYDI
jgi:hypothetical protein